VRPSDATLLLRERRNEQLEQLDQLQRRRLRAARGSGNSSQDFSSRNVAGGPAAENMSLTSNAFAQALMPVSPT
jgi:hypothetical protein